MLLRLLIKGQNLPARPIILNRNNLNVAKYNLGEVKHKIMLTSGPKMSISGQIVSEIVAQLCLENSIQTFLNFFGSTPKKIRRIWMEFSEYNRLTSQRQFAQKCSFLASRPLGHCSFRISLQIP